LDYHASVKAHACGCFLLLKEFQAGQQVLPVASAAQQITALQGRITRLQVSALHLPPEPKSWAEALTLCNGDYDTAARRYPNLKAARMGKA
jgi:hypothetical protein